MAASVKHGIPYGLLRYQGPMLRASGHMLWQAALRGLFPRKTSLPQATTFAPVRRLIAAPPQALIDHYLAWCQRPDTSPASLPPDMVGQWSLPLVSQLLLELPFSLTRIINQGVSMKLHAELPRGVALQVQAQFEEIASAGGWIRLCVLIRTGTQAQENLLETRLHMRIRESEQRTVRSTPAARPAPHWQGLGSWHTEADDGLRFALLTGDFNPIHWCAPVARRSVFRGKVLHGFGSLARSYAMLANTGMRELELRFLRPVPLPCAAIALEQSDTTDADGWREVRLCSSDAAVHMVGRIR